MDFLISRRPNANANRKRAVRPTVEGLEDRMLLYAVTGDHFNYGSRITWSVMPDGTNLGSANSNLISTLNNDLGASTNWLLVFQDAFAQWENVANVNFAQVGDNGAQFGAGNIQQGSPYFGDIRIGGLAQPQSTLAFTILPPAANGGSDSGDIIFNTALPWHINSDYDLETVLVHEIGHALGMGHSASQTAVMYPYYSGIDVFPSSDDVAGVDSIWSPRQEDGIASSFNNFTISSAFNLNNFVNTNTNQAYVPFLDVASSAESYWFKITTPANASNVFTAQVQSAGLSELSPHVMIFNSAGQGLVQTCASPLSYGATIDATITNATPNTVYYIRVLGSSSGDSGSGGYAMTLNMGTQAIPNALPPNTLVYAQSDQGGGVVLEQVGGANTSANTPADPPDYLSLGSLVVEGDALTATPAEVHEAKLEEARQEKVGKVRIKSAHPTRRATTKTTKMKLTSHHAKA